MTASRVLGVVYVVRESRTGILSARKAESKERLAYHEHSKP
jgi:uncharacterized DUF497 family protein